jgi:hypothetical protein
VALGGVELWAQNQPVPRVQQIFDESAHGLQLVDGIPTWHGGQHHLARWNLECTESGSTDVVLLGSSIFYGVRLEGSATLGHQLARQLGAGGTTPCVVNLAQPGSAFENQEATYKLFLNRLKPKVVVWEIWHNSANRFTPIGDLVYNFGRLRRDELGLPSAFGLSPGVNRALFRTFAAYRFVNLTLAETTGEKTSVRWARFVEEAVAPAVERLQEEGTQVLLVYAPALSRPFDQSTVAQTHDYRVAEAWAQSAGVETVDLAQALGAADPSALGVDTCCHLNEEGTQKVAGILASPVRRMLGTPTP